MILKWYRFHFFQRDMPDSQMKTALHAAAHPWSFQEVAIGHPHELR
jgi:hypothetical protein